MRFIISHAAVVATAAQLNEVTTVVTDTFGMDAEKPLVIDPGFTDTSLANFSVTSVNEEFVVEINDDVLIRYMQFYLRVVRFIAPVAKSLYFALEGLSHEWKELEAFIKLKR